MKRFLLSLAIALMALPIAAAQDGDALKKLEKILDRLPAGKSDVTVTKVVTIRASDVRDAVATVATQRATHPAKPVKLIVLPAKKLTLDEAIDLIAQEKEIPVELFPGQDLEKAFRSQIETLAVEDSDLRTLLAKEPGLEKHVEYIEEKQKTKTRHEHLKLTERVRRATWLMMLPRNDLASIRFE